MTATRMDPLARALKRVWAMLPADPMTERELEEQIIRIRGMYEGDFAAAGAVRGSLTSAGAVIVRQGDGAAEWIYEKAETFPEWPDNGYGTDAMNAELKRQSDAEQARLRELDQQRAEEFENGPWGSQRRAIIELVEATVDRRIGELLKGVDDDVMARVPARLAVSPDDDTDDDAA